MSTPTEPTTHCLECGQQLLLVRPGRDRCERCLLDDVQRYGPEALKRYLQMLRAGQPTEGAI